MTISNMTINDPITAPTITPALLSSLSLSSSSPLLPLPLSAELPQLVGLLPLGDDVLLVGPVVGSVATTQRTL